MNRHIKLKHIDVSCRAQIQAMIRFTIHPYDYLMGTVEVCSHGFAYPACERFAEPLWVRITPAAFASFGWVFVANCRCPFTNVCRPWSGSQTFAIPFQVRTRSTDYIRFAPYNFESWSSGPYVIQTSHAYEHESSFLSHSHRDREVICVGYSHELGYNTSMIWSNDIIILLMTHDA